MPVRGMESTGWLNANRCDNGAPSPVRVVDPSQLTSRAMRPSLKRSWVTALCPASCPTNATCGAAANMSTYSRAQPGGPAGISTYRLSDVTVALLVRTCRQVNSQCVMLRLTCCQNRPSSTAPGTGHCCIRQRTAAASRQQHRAATPQYAQGLVSKRPACSSCRCTAASWAVLLTSAGGAAFATYGCSGPTQNAGRRAPTAGGW